MKKIISVLFLIIMLISLSVSTNAYYNTKASLHTEMNVYDDLMVLSSGEINDIDTKIDTLIQNEYVDMLIFLTDSSIEEVTTDYVTSYYYENGYGMGPTSNGIIMLYDKNYNSVEILRGGSALSFLTEENVISLENFLTQELGSENYYGGLMAFIDETKSILDENIAKGNPNKIVDNSDVLTDSQETELLNTINSTIEQVNIDVAVVTVDSTYGVDIMNYTDDYYDYNHYGLGENNDGIILLVATQDRAYHFTTTGSAIATFENDISNMQTALESNLSTDDYFGAFNTFTDEVYDVVLNPFTLVDGLIALAIGIVVAIIVCAVLASQLKSVKKQALAHQYIRQNSFSLENRHDLFLYKTVTSRTKSSSSSGGGSHTGSSGTSHGGGGGRY